MTANTEDPAEQQRRRILDEAEALFVHYGYWKTSVNDIAKACAMSAGNLYRYFRNKQAIGLAVVKRHFDRERALMAEAAAAPGSAEARIRRVIGAVSDNTVSEMQVNPKLIETAEMLCGEADGLRLLDAYIADKRAVIAGLMREGAESGELAPGDPVEAARLINLATLTFCMPFSLAHYRDLATVPAEREAVLDLCFQGLRLTRTSSPAD